MPPTAVKELHLAGFGTGHGVPILVNAGILSAGAQPIDQPGGKNPDCERDDADEPQSRFFAIQRGWIDCRFLEGIRHGTGGPSGKLNAFRSLSMR